MTNTEGTEGQDRESYTDDQDRDSYTVTRPFTFTLTATFDAVDRDDAWNQWVAWLSNPRAVEDGTEVTEDE